MMDGKPYPVPKPWTESSIGEVVVKAKQRDPRKKPDEVFKYVDVSSVSNKSFEISSATPTLGSEAPSRARKAIETDDVLFATVRPTLKRIALVPPELDGVRPMRNKWASCSTNGHLNFSNELLNLEPKLWDYVIVHELLHFSAPNHGKLWKSLMRAHLGEWEKAEAELRRMQ